MRVFVESLILFGVFSLLGLAVVVAASSGLHPRLLVAPGLGVAFMFALATTAAAYLDASRQPGLADEISDTTRGLAGLLDRGDAWVVLACGLTLLGVASTGSFRGFFLAPAVGSELYYGAVLWLPLLLLHVVLHEYAHAAAARAAGLPWTVLRAGPLEHARGEGLRLRRWRLLSESGWLRYARGPSWRAALGVAAAGPAAHLALGLPSVVALAALPLDRGLAALAVTNAYVAVVMTAANLMPFELRGPSLDLGGSDGATILQLLRERWVRYDFSDQLQLELARDLPLSRSAVSTAECARVLDEPLEDGGWRLLLATWRVLEAGEIGLGGRLLDHAALHRDRLAEDLRPELAALDAAFLGLVRQDLPGMQVALHAARTGLAPEALDLHRAVELLLSGDRPKARTQRNVAVRRLLAHPARERAGRDWIRAALTAPLGPEPALGAATPTPPAPAAAPRATDRRAAR